MPGVEPGVEVSHEEALYDHRAARPIRLVADESSVGQKQEII
jgi:hypothetical protein